MSSSDEEVVRRPGRSTDASRVQSPSASERSASPNGRAESPLGSDKLNADDDADLFGSDGDLEEPSERPRRTIDDEELDSGDDEGRYDRAGDRMDYDEGEEGGYRETLNVMDLNLGRAPEPESSNGEVYTLTVPNFLSIETEEFNPETYVAPPFSTASTSLCWRFDPNDPSSLQSNARIIRWEDGSLTLQLASAPQEQYRISSKPLAPLNKAGDYESEFDAHAYLGAAAERASVFHLTSHLTHGLTILPTTHETDDAVQRLQEAMAAAARAGRKNPDGTVTVIDVKEDPELAKKQAEMAEREKLKAARRRQQLADRDLDRGRRVGMSYRTGGAGLTVGGLEDDDGMMTTRPRAKKPRKPNRRGEIYTDEEEEYDRRGRTREDEYDEDDGFLVGSDEEPEVVDDDDEEEEELEDEDAEGELDDDVAPAKSSRKEREASPKRKSPEPAGGAGSPPVRKKHRYVVESDEDEE
ncbi:Leo1-like protein-domain-containing protein [Paecilomyces variotii]|uniref:Leo1-like protein-domain-containing protein n=1 Tax=Byssochlamys spectabilis TaxID=264951 RepID=A0A443I6G7_BYSSP|nr:Leo1-like protein-domain-containing protein [Paecilomyces variotii]RWQ99674.1 Leo1-like protein-domain-containing protein [Paecilomyces variotii]